MNAIRCRACGTLNDLTAISCSKCAESLVDAGSDAWGAAHERVVAREAVVEERRERRRSVLFIVGFVVLIGAVLIGGYYTHDYMQQNFYLMGEPLYDNQPASYWTVLLKSDDHYLRQRGALALDTLADKMNATTARTVIPDLEAALNDDDEVVRLRAASALDKIKRTTGESGSTGEDTTQIHADT